MHRLGLTLPFAICFSLATLAAQNSPPPVINSCTDQGATPKGRFCLAWIRDGDAYRQTASQLPPVTVQRFDRTTAIFIAKQGGQTITYSGTVAGNRISGTVKYSLDSAPAAKLPGVEPLGSAIGAAIAAAHAPTANESAAQSKPTGAEAAAQADPDRLVAIIDGNRISARQALNLLNNVDPRVRKERENNLPGLLQQLYMQHAIAAEATRLNLQKQLPWATQLGNAQMSTVGRFTPASSAPPAVALQ